MPKLVGIEPQSAKCQHPTSRTPRCGNDSIGEYEISPDYHPNGRKQIPRPTASLCGVHKTLMESKMLGKPLNGHSHELMCKVCQHPRRAEVDAMWIAWAMTTGDACRELGVKYSVWMRHVEMTGMWDKKQKRVNTKRALVLAAEKGFEGGGHNAATGLRALQQLSKERGDADIVQHQVSGLIGVVDVTKLSDIQLAELAESLAQQLRDNPQPPQALVAGRDDSDVIDIPSRRVEATVDR